MLGLGRKIGAAAGRWMRALLVVGLMAAPTSALAHIVTEAPWHPLAFAYRSTVFLLNLQPTDWPLIARKLATDDDGRIAGAPAAARLRQLDALTGQGHWAAIETALAAKRPEALFAATSRAVSAALRHQLAQAALHLDNPSLATRDLEEAGQIYRAFADFIEQADPAGFKELGIAWLELSSSIGHAGVMTVGARAADAGAFATAQGVIDAYFRANYEPDEFIARRSYAPVPELGLRANPNFQPAAWLPPGSDLNDQDPLPRLVLNFEQHGVAEEDLFLVAYGDMLFDSPEVFGEPASRLGLACSTCHNRSDINRRFFIPGISAQAGSADVDGSFFHARFNDHKADPLDIPSLRGLRFTAPYGRDGRFASLRDFTRNVIVGEFGGDEPSPLMLDALVAYQLEFDFLPAPLLDANGRLVAQASSEAKRGEQLFRQPFEQMGDQSCASCHTPSSHFTDNSTHDIGSTGDGAASGFSGALDTPTLLNSLYTAPYFHDGSLPTLAAVVRWFDERFGLELDRQQQADLTAYLEAVGKGREPYQQFDALNTPFRLQYEELNTFLATLDTLIPDQDRAHADLLLRTLASDLEADAVGLTNQAPAPPLQALVEQLWHLRDLVRQDSWTEAAEQWRAYRTLAERHDAEMR